MGAKRGYPFNWRLVFVCVAMLVMAACCMLAAVGPRVAVAQEGAHSHDGVEFVAWTSEDSLPSEAGNYCLTSDVTLASTWQTPSGTTKVCLNGHNICCDFDGEDASNPGIRVLEGTTLDLYDCKDGGMLTPCEGKNISNGIDVWGNGICMLNGGTITGFKNGVWTDLKVANKEEGTPAAYGKFIMNGGAVSGNSQKGVYVFSGTFEMNGGLIANNGTNTRTGVEESDNGAGVYVSWSTFKMTGGEISDNAASEDGGGLYLFRTTDPTMTGGTIKNNTAGKNGGGVYLNGSTFTVNGGYIEDNTAGEDGGGVYVISRVDLPQYGPGNFVLKGGSIAGNTASGKGGGLYVYNNAKMELSSTSSAPQVTGNTAAGSASNVYLDNALITVKSQLANGTSVGVTMEEPPGTFTTGFKGATQGADPATYFTSDSDEFIVTADAQGEGRLAVVYPVTVADGIQNGTVEVDKAKAAEGDSVKVTATPADGYELDTVTVKDADGKQIETRDGSFTMPAKAVTVFATFAKKAEPAPAPAKASKPSTVAHIVAGTIDASWKKAKGAKTYQVQWRVAGAKKWTTKSVKKTSFTIPGLKADKLYDIRVRGVKGSTKGAWSRVTRRWLRGVSKVKAKSGTSKGSVKVTWKKDKKATGGYKVLVYAKKGGKLVTSKVVSKAKASATIKGLKSGKTYYVRVRPYRTRGSATYVGALSGYRSVRAK